MIVLTGWYAVVLWCLFWSEQKWAQLRKRISHSSELLQLYLRTLQNLYQRVELCLVNAKSIMIDMQKKRERKKTGALCLRVCFLFEVITDTWAPDGLAVCDVVGLDLRPTELNVWNMLIVHIGAVLDAHLFDRQIRFTSDNSPIL